MYVDSTCRSAAHCHSSALSCFGADAPTPIPGSPGSAKLSVLGLLYRQGPLTPTQLALQEQVRLQTLTRLLAELQADGHVARQPHSSDARQSVLSLTASGARLLTNEVRRRESSLASALDAELNKDERALLVHACDLIDRVAQGMSLGVEKLPMSAQPMPARKATGRLS